MPGNHSGFNLGKNKLFRFQALTAFPHVHQDLGTLAGNWHKVFKNEHPIVLELACGYGEYTLELAQRYPDFNFIGIDIKGARIYQGAHNALVQNIKNAHFARMQIDHIEAWFHPQEVHEIWITFPDPYPTQPKARKRLTHPMFLSRYQRILKKGSKVHLKTDNTGLYEFTLEVLHQYEVPVLINSSNVYKEDWYQGEMMVKTRYEKIFSEKGESIKYIQFSIPEDADFGEFAIKSKFRPI